MKPSYIKNSLLKTINFMAQDPSPFVKRPGVDFTRNRKCSFSSLLLMILSMETSDLDREIRRFFKTSERLITKSAFIQQRQKLNEKVFPFLFSEMNRLFPFKKTYKGYHLLAVDGSDENIPHLKDDMSTRIASNTAGVYYDQIHLNAVYHLLERRYTDLILQPRAEVNEREAFLSFLSRNNVPGKCIFIADRGYASLNVLAHLLNSGQSFLLRMKADDAEHSLLSRFSLPNAAEFDIPLEFTVTRSKKNVFANDPAHYICLRRDRRFDFIDPDDQSSFVPLSVRLAKVELPGGSSEFLVTNLPTDKFSKDDLKELYRLRWGIETSFRTLKYNVALNYFHSIRRDFITQEIYARIILYNFTMLTVNCIPIPKKDTKLQWKVSVSDAVGVCRDFLIEKIKNAEIEALISRYLTSVRPGRSFPRKVRAKRVVPLVYRA